MTLHQKYISHIRNFGVFAKLKTISKSSQEYNPASSEINACSYTEGFMFQHLQQPHISTDVVRVIVLEAYFIDEKIKVLFNSMLDIG